jgi:hypothetical protein
MADGVARLNAFFRRQGVAFDDLASVVVDIRARLRLSLR